MEDRNYGKFYELLHIMPLEGQSRDELKEQLVMQWTGGRTRSLRETTEAEYRKMVTWMEHLYCKRTDERELRRRLRSICLKLLQQIGVDTTDWTAINSYCMSPKIAGAEFGKIDNEGLESLSRKLRVILKKKAC